MLMELLYKWKIYIISIKEDIDRRSHVESFYKSKITWF